MLGMYSFVSLELYDVQQSEYEGGGEREEAGRPNRVLMVFVRRGTGRAERARNHSSVEDWQQQVSLRDTDKQDDPRQSANGAVLCPRCCPNITGQRWRGADSRDVGTRKAHANTKRAATATAAEQQRLLGQGRPGEPSGCAGGVLSVCELCVVCLWSQKAEDRRLIACICRCTHHQSWPRLLFSFLLSPVSCLLSPVSFLSREDFPALLPRSALCACCLNRKLKHS